MTKEDLSKSDLVILIKAYDDSKRAIEVSRLL